MVDVLPLVAFILTIVAFVFDIALSFSPNYWFYRKTTVSSVTTETFIGLWNYVLKVRSGSSVTETSNHHSDDNYPVDKMFIGASQVFQCVGILLLVATIVSLILKLFVMKDKTFLTALACAHAIWAALCLVGSAGTFGHGIRVFNTSNEEYWKDLHFSFGFAVISGVISLVAGILLLVSMVQNRGRGIEPKA